MSVSQEQYDPDATVWNAVTELEKKAYTNKEMYDTLVRVADELRPDNGFER